MRSAPVFRPNTTGPLARAVDTATSLKQAWREGGEPDLEEALKEHPSLLTYRSLVVDLAVEEYLALEEAGRPPNLERYRRLVPNAADSVGRYVAAHQLLKDCPNLLMPGHHSWPGLGDSLEGLTLLGELGRGATARAYFAFDPETARACVIKLTSGRSNEGQVLGKLPRHPHITEVYWARQVGGRTAVCMPFVGTSTLELLRAKVDDNGLPHGLTGMELLDAIEPVEGERSVTPVVRASHSFEECVTAIVARIADALAHLHQAGVVHGDIKPSNIILATGGRPCLIDFHLATEGAATGGTLPYMAPEVLDRLVGRSVPSTTQGFQSDVYSLGTVIYELVAGRLPHTPKPGSLREVAGELRDRIEKGVDLRPLAALPRSVRQLIARCLSVDPAQRPAAAYLSERLNACTTRGSHPERIVSVIAVGCLVIFGAAFGPWRNTPSSSPELSKSAGGRETVIKRGRAFLAGGHFREARSEFAAANRTQPEARLYALQAYCEANMEEFREAAYSGRKATEANYKPVAVVNNLAYCLNRSGEPMAAVELLDEANTLAPGRPEILFNRAYARARLSDKHVVTVTDLRVVTDLRLAIAGKNLTPRGWKEAGLLLAACSGVDPTAKADALHCLSEAVSRGVNATDFLSHPALRPLSSSPGFAELALTPAGSDSLPTTPFGLIEPAWGD